VTSRVVCSALAATLLLCGCALTPQGAKQLREAPEVTVQEENLELALVAFKPEEPHDSLTMALLIESTVELALKLKVKESKPGVYTRIVQALQDVARGAKLTDSGAVSFVQSYAVYSLTRFEDPDHLQFLLDRLGSEKHSAERSMDIAALTGVVHFMPRVVASTKMRMQLAKVMPSLSSSTNSQLGRLATFVESELKTPEVGIDLLSSAKREHPSDEEMLRRLTWGYELLLHLQKKPASKRSAAQARKLVDLVLALTSHPKKIIAKRARSILLQRSPYVYFVYLSRRLEKVKSRGVVEDLVHFLPYAHRLSNAYRANPPKQTQVAFRFGKQVLINEAARLKATPFTKLRTQILRAVFGYCRANASALRREFVYASLFDYDPHLLARFLVKHTSAMVSAESEGEKEAAQHGRYLTQLLGKAAVKKQPRTFAAVRRSLAQLVSKPIPAVHRQVAAVLAAQDPLSLTLEAGAVLRRMDMLSTRMREVALATYLTGLTAYQQRSQDAMRKFPVDEIDLPYGVLVQAVAQKAPAVCEVALKFLLDRDPNVAVLALNARLAHALESGQAPALPFLLMYIDVIAANRSSVDRSTIHEAVLLLAQFLERVDAEIALHFVRALGESGDPKATSILEAYRESDVAQNPALEGLIALYLGERKSPESTNGKD
jgi:hypothetical protein